MEGKWGSFKLDVRFDEKGLPYSFEVNEGAIEMGGFGSPDQLVMGAISTGLLMWDEGIEKGDDEIEATGDYYVNVGLAVADRINDFLGSDVKAVVEKLKSELEPNNVH